MAEQGDQDQDDKDDGDADEGIALEEAAGAEPGEVRLGADTHRIAVGGDEKGDAPERRKGSEGGDDGIDAQEGHDRAVDEPRDKAGDQPRDERVLHPAPGGIDGQRGHDASDAGNRAHGDVERPGDDHDRFADRQHTQHGDVLAERVQQVALPEEEW